MSESKQVSENLVCAVTGHPCGTDTYPKGWTCQCQSCQAWLIELLDQQAARIAQLEAIVKGHFEMLARARQQAVNPNGCTIVGQSFT